MANVKQNPKHIRAMKEGKAPLEYLITSVEDGDAKVLKGGADKYGVRNWLIDKILASTYEAAIKRHLKEWVEGRDIDSNSGEHHFHHIRACCAIVLDAEKAGMLVDDRDRAESISQEKEEEKEGSIWGTSAPDWDPEYAWCVRYTTEQKSAISFPVTHTKTYGPFDSYDDATEFVNDNRHAQLGIATIDRLISS